MSTTRNDFDGGTGKSVAPASVPTDTAPNQTTLTADIAPDEVEAEVRKHLIADGFEIVFDLERSHGSWIVDARDGSEYLDFYTFFASLPLGFRHPAFETEENRARLLRAARIKPANSDAHTEALARFVRHFGARAMPEGFEHLFFIEGGALAVENALKLALAGKVRQNMEAGRSPVDGRDVGTQVLHFREAFHGRSGYTMSLTNTSPMKTAYFPKFDWPRVVNPKLRFPVDEAELDRVVALEMQCFQEITEAFRQANHDIAAILVEPIQGEGGDNHFRPEFFQGLRRLADEFGALLIFDEVQTGFGMTGKMWAFEHYGVTPDVVAFGKKSQVCGVMAGPRVDEVSRNVFQVSSRINSTWGGGLVDMVRCDIILDVIEQEGLVDNAAHVGDELLHGLENLSTTFPGAVSNVRGRGLMCAFDCPEEATRDRILERCLAEHVLALACGDRSVRLRPPLTLSSEEAAEGVRRITQAVSSVVDGD